MAATTSFDAVGALPAVRLVSEAGDEALVTAHGAHPVRWRTADGRERLFTSARSTFARGTAIRGGIPIIFPQFAATGPYPRHGFARTTDWQLHAHGVGASGPLVRFTLADDERTRAAWPFSFSAAVDVHLPGAALEVALHVRNPADAPLAFTAALHTYLLVDDLAAITLHGLGGCRMRDGVRKTEVVDASPAVQLAGEVDRIYFDVPGAVTLREGRRDQLRIAADGFPDVVVWNPGLARGGALPDLAPEEVSRFVCVEAAAVGAPITLAPGESWVGRQRLDAL